MLVVAQKNITCSRPNTGLQCHPISRPMADLDRRCLRKERHLFKACAALTAPSIYFTGAAKLDSDNRPAPLKQFRGRLAAVGMRWTKILPHECDRILHESRDCKLGRTGIVLNLTRFFFHASSDNAKSMLLTVAGSDRCCLLQYMNRCLGTCGSDRLSDSPLQGPISDAIPTNEVDLRKRRIPRSNEDVAR